MDWLRSEDLKEEKNVTAPNAIVASDEPVVAQERRGVPLGMHRKNPECFDADSSDRSEAADLLFREEPDEEEDEEEEDGEEKDDDGDEGYSE